MLPKSIDDEKAQETTRARRLEKLRFWRSACSVERPVVTRYNGSQDGLHLFFFHGDWDNGGVYMAKLVGDLRSPVVALAPHLDPVPASIRAMAEDRLTDILAIQPEGPYRIGGFCNGALVAYEAAQLLIERGHSVEVVLLIAPPSLNAGRAYRKMLAFAKRLLGATAGDASPARLRRVVALMAMMTALRRLTSYSPRELGIVFSRKKRHRTSVRERLRTAHAERPTDVVAETALHDRRRTLLEAYGQAIYLYHPKPIPSRLVVFGTGLDKAGRPGFRYDAAYDGRAWAELCPQAKCIPVSGDHYTCIADHAAELADAMRGALGVSPSGQKQPARHAAKSVVPRASAGDRAGASKLSPASLDATEPGAQPRPASSGLEDVA